MKQLTALVAVAAVFCAAPVFACDKEKAAQAKASGCHGKEVQTAAAKEGCHGKAGTLASKVMEKLPRMHYRVGEFTTPCAETAAEKAGTEGKIQYVVDGKSYDCRGDATAALAALLEKEAADMMTVRYAVGEDTYGCPMSAKHAATEKKAAVSYRLAGLDFRSQEEADNVAKRVSEAVAKLAAGEGATAEAAPAKSGCGMKAEAAKVSATSGCTKAKAETASATGGCGKAKAETASADGRSEGAPAASGCCKSKAKAETASAKSGCDKAKAETASAKSGCDKAKAQTASASDSDGCKSKAAAFAAAGGCDKAKAQMAAAPGCCSKDKATATGTPTCCEQAEQRVASARAKLQVIIETVLASSAS